MTHQPYQPYEPSEWSKLWAENRIQQVNNYAMHAKFFREDHDNGLQSAIVWILHFLYLCSNNHGKSLFPPHMQFQLDDLMREITGGPACGCTYCIGSEGRTIRDAELAFAGFRQYVEACAALKSPNPNFYNAALSFIANSPRTPTTEQKRGR